LKKTRPQSVPASKDVDLRRHVALIVDRLT
jgi:hypothetical protein